MDIHEIQYRLEIMEQLAERYCGAVDSLDWKLFSSIFDDEFYFDFHDPMLAHCPEPRFIRQDEWLKFASMMAGFDATQHYMTNHIIKIDGETAEVRVYLLAELKIGDESYRLGGEYKMQMRRTNGGWKIQNYGLRPRWTRGPQSLFDVAIRRVAEGKSARPSLS